MTVFRPFRDNKVETSIQERVDLLSRRWMGDRPTCFRGSGPALVGVVGLVLLGTVSGYKGTSFPTGKFFTCFRDEPDRQRNPPQW